MNGCHVNNLLTNKITNKTSIVIIVWMDGWMDARMTRSMQRLISQRQTTHNSDDPPITLPFIRPQFSCPDFAMGTASRVRDRIDDPMSAAPVVSDTPPTFKRSNVQGGRLRKKNSFVQMDSYNESTVDLDSGKRGKQDHADGRPPKRHNSGAQSQLYV
jgi:hypothetical protein